MTSDAIAEAGDISPMRDKIGLISFFALGFVICVMTLMRVLSLVNFHESPDIPYVQVTTAIAPFEDLA